MFDREPQECLYTRTCRHCSAYGRCLSLPVPRPVEESPIGGSQLRQPGFQFVDFHLPRNRPTQVLNGTDPTDGPSTYSIPANELHVQLFVPDPNPRTEYSHLLRRANNGQALANIRQTLYAFNEENDRWESVNSNLLPAVDLNDSGSEPYKPGAWVGLPQQYWDREVFGHLAIGLNTAATNMTMAYRNVHSTLQELNPAIQRSASGNSEVTHFDDPSGAYGRRSAYLVERVAHIGSPD